MRLKVVVAGTNLFVNSVCTLIPPVSRRHGPRGRVTRLVAIPLDQPENHEPDCSMNYVVTSHISGIVSNGTTSIRQ